MIDERFIFIGALLSLIGGFDYIKSTIKGETKPNRVTWLIWGLAPMIAFFSEISQGVGLQSLMTFMVGFVPLLIFLASFVNKKSYWQLSRLDITCGLLSLGGLVLWQITKVGNLAIIFSLLADLLAGIPTIVKSFHYPETENYKVFFFSGINASITLLTITAWNLAFLAWPLYIFLIDWLQVVLIKYKAGLYLKKKFAVA